MEGNQQVATKDLPALLLKPGQPLNPQLERADIVALQTFYGDRGNTEVQVKPREEVSEDKTSAKVTFTIAEGPEIKVDQVIVRGNTYTNSNVVLKQAYIDRMQTAPVAVTRREFKLESKSKAITAFKEFAGRSHYIVGEPGWEEVADFALDWALNPKPINETI